MNALMLLKTDHKNVESLFSQFENLGERGKNTRQKKQLVSKMIRELSIHATIEEQIFYPAVRHGIKQADSLILEALEEHHHVKWSLSELDGMNAEDERFDAKVHVLIEMVRSHVKEEENELFPMVRQKMDRALLDDMGTLLEKAKRVAPTRPHPRAPDSPPANIVAGMGAGMLDKARDAGRALVQRVTTRARDGQQVAARMGRTSSSSKSKSKSKSKSPPPSPANGRKRSQANGKNSIASRER